MTAVITEGEWSPLPGSLPKSVESESIYVLPTHKAVDPDDGIPRYADNVRYLPKSARAAGIPLEFSTPVGSRKYVQHFSIDPELWALGLTLLSMANSWLILTVELFIYSRTESQGWTEEEARKLPLKVAIAETSTKRNVEIEGAGEDVLEALRILQQQAADRDQAQD